MKRGYIFAIMLLYVICAALVISRIYQIFEIDDGFVFGDVTNHYFQVGQAVLEGQNPYDSRFINHPPFMLLLFTLIVWIHPAPYSIAIFILGTYLLVPIVSFFASRSFLSDRNSVISTWLVTLNPLTVYAGVSMLDDDLLIMLMILVTMNLYPSHPRLAMICAGIFAGFKFVPLAIGLFLLLNDREMNLYRKLSYAILCCIPFIISMYLGFSLWGAEALHRIYNYVNTVGVSYPSMSPFYIIARIFAIDDNSLFRIIAVASAAFLIISFCYVGRKNEISVRDSLPHFTSIALVAIYLGNATTNYTYFTWIIPILAIIALEYGEKNRYLLMLFLMVLVTGLGYFVSEWANFTWGYGPLGEVFANIAVIFVWASLAIFVSLSFNETLKKQMESKGRETPLGLEK